MLKITAEIGSHWLGDFKLLECLVAHCKQIGFDYVKLQAISKARLARHPELDYYESSSVDNRNISQIAEIMKKYSMEWYVTPTYPEAVEILEPYVNTYKIAAYDMENEQLKEKVFSTGKRVFVSTSRPFKHDDKRILNLYCISRYPTPYTDINWDMLQYFDGYSCHTPEFRAVFKAIEKGAQYIEIHVTPSKAKFFLDNPVSFSITECYDLVRWARKLENCRDNTSQADVKQIPKQSSSQNSR